MKRANETDSSFVDRVINESVYECTGMQVILKAIKNGIYRLGNIHSLNYYTDTSYASLKNYSEEQLTDEVCKFLISYGKCHFDDVPEKARTRNFYLNAFTDKEVYDYVKNHINEFDEQFFKDLIATNHYALIFSRNAFEVMPLEYITTEMVDIAFLSDTDWSGSSWFESVVKRKPEVISYQAWVCAARYYTSTYNILKDVPEMYKTNIFYLELMSCCYNVGMSLEQDKEMTIKHIDKEVFTSEFLKNLICLDISNIGRIPEDYLNVMLDFDGRIIELWKVGIMAEAETITRIEPTKERIQFFKDIYGDNSFKYELYCKNIDL